MANDAADGRLQLHHSDSGSGVAVTCGGTHGNVHFDSNGDFHFRSSKVSSNCCSPSDLPPAKVAKNDIVGATLESTASFKVWYCQATKPKAANPGFQLKVTKALECTSAADAERLVKEIRQDACWWGRQQPPRAVVIVNPASGKLKAKQMVRETVLPVIAGAAGWEVEVKETQRAGHATELVQGLDPHAADALLVVGGDGTLFEVVQGMMTRPDWKDATAHLPICHVPGGTGNGMASSAGLWNGIGAVRAVLKGHSRPLDVASVLQPPSSRYYTVLSVVYGIVANLEVGTDHLRWMGEARFTLGAVREVFKRTRHCCRIAWLPASPTYDPPPPPSPLADGSSPPPKAGLTVDSFPAGPDLPLLRGLQAFQGGNLLEKAPAAQVEVPRGWRVLGEEGEATGVQLFTLANVPYLSSSYHCNPEGAMDSGHLDVVWGSGGSIPQSLQTLVASESGAHLKLPWIRSDSVRALVLEPIGDTSHFRLDGEVVPRRTLYVEVHPGLLQLLVAPEAARHH